MNTLRRFLLNLIQQKPDLVAVLFLILITTAAHRAWLAPNAYITFGDWVAWPDSITKDFYKGWSAWSTIGDLGGSNFSVAFFPFLLVWSLVLRMGGTFALGVHLNFLWPIALLSVLAPYALARHLKATPLTSTVAALLYGTSTYYLILQNGQLTIAFVMSLLPLFFLFADKFLEEDNRVMANLAVFAVLYSMAFSYELRITLIATVLIIIYALTKFAKLWRRRYYLLALVVLIFALNAYWIFPFVLGGGSGATAAVTARSIFGDWLASTSYALANVQWSWTGGPTPLDFTPQTIPWYLWIESATAILGLVVFTLPQKPQIRRLGLYFAFISLAGILLTKQSDEPFRGLYLWMYEHVPLFNIYRESSKFYLVTTFGYFGLSLLGLEWLRERYVRAYYVLIGLLLCVTIYTFRPLYNMSVGGLFVHRQKPAAYTMLDSKIDADPAWFRTVWVPRPSGWSDVGLIHPRLNLVELSQGAWRDSEKVAPGTAIPELQDTMAPFGSPYAANLMNQSGIRYVIVPQYYPGTENNFLSDYPNRQRYGEELGKLPYLHKVESGIPDLIMYENPTYLSRFYLTSEGVNSAEAPKIASNASLHWSIVDSARYTVQIDKAPAVVYLQFPETYTPDWRLYAPGGLSSALFGKPIAGIIPERTDFGLMQYRLDLADLASKGLATKHADGTYSFSTTVFYRGQQWFYRGILLTILAITFIVGLGLGLLIRKKRHAKA